LQVRTAQVHTLTKAAAEIGTSPLNSARKKSSSRHSRVVALFVASLGIVAFYLNSDARTPTPDKSPHDFHRIRGPEGVVALTTVRMSPFNDTQMEEGQRDFCGKCEVEINRDRVIDFTLKSGKRVCEQCFVRETPRPAPIRPTVDRGREKWRAG
jgi:hypothetical protein